MANKLRRAILASRMTEKEFSELSGFTLTYIDAVASGRLPPSPSLKKKASEVLKMDAETIFPPDDKSRSKLRVT